MNKKEIAEIRKRFNSENTNITSVRGCYVNSNAEIISEFTQNFLSMSEGESEKFLAILKKTFSGSINRNLVDVGFSTPQVTQGEEHKLLTNIRNSKLADDEAVTTFFSRVIETVKLEENYVILLAHDVYDVPYRSSDDIKQFDASESAFSYIVCSICPVKMTKPALSYYVKENKFQSRTADWLVSPPQLGFMFPAFDDRRANIYGALYYTKDSAQDFPAFTDAIFASDMPMPAAEQKITFQHILSATLGGDCNLNMVQSINGKLDEIIQVHKEIKEEQPLTISKGIIKEILQEKGASEDSLKVFESEFDGEFGEDAHISPQNIVSAKTTQLKTPEVTIRISTQGENLVETRIIDGVKYILIRAEEGVEIDGIPIHIT